MEEVKTLWEVGAVYTRIVKAASSDEAVEAFYNWEDNGSGELRSNDELTCYGTRRIYAEPCTDADLIMDYEAWEEDYSEEEGEEAEEED